MRYIPALFVSAALLAQDPAFEVATVKSNKSGQLGQGARPVTGGIFYYHNGTLGSFLRQAYSLMRYQLTGGPAWMDIDRWDIEGKVGEEKRDMVWPMMRTLLADRFQVKLHRETHQMPVYWLTVDKKGRKMNPSGEGKGGRVRNGKGLLEADDLTMPMLARWLEQAMERPVVDRTGLSGGYNVRLKWTVGVGEVGYDPSEAAVDSGLPTLFTAIQENLGLRLESGRGPIEVVVIDRAEKPSDN